MYPIGILFGLGFDTATEISLLVLAGTTVAAGLPFWAILSLPIVFAAGMSLLDTIDGSFMNFAYGWSFSRPARKIYYNITITGLSVAVALFIGGLEIAQVLSGQLHLTGGVWTFADGLDLNHAGFVIVGAFVVVWSVALGVARRPDRAPVGARRARRSRRSRRGRGPPRRRPHPRRGPRPVHHPQGGVAEDLSARPSASTAAAKSTSSSPTVSGADSVRTLPIVTLNDSPRRSDA